MNGEEYTASARLVADGSRGGTRLRDSVRRHVA